MTCTTFSLKGALFSKIICVRNRPKLLLLAFYSVPVSPLSYVSCVPASCVHIWFVSCPRLLWLLVNSVPGVCMWLWWLSLCIYSTVCSVRFRLGCIPESMVNLPSAKPWTFGWLTPKLAYSWYVVPKMHPGVSSFNSRVCSWLRLKTFSTERRIDKSLWKRMLRKHAMLFLSSFVQWLFTCLVHIAT